MWNNLSLKEKAELIQAGVKAGYRDIDSIRERFNSFSKGDYQEPLIQRTQEQLPVENVENSDYSVVPKLDYYKDPNEQQVNKFDKGGNYTVGNLVDAIYQNNPKEEYLGKPSHNYDFTQSEEWANAHGYYPDARGHRDDRVKKPAHPSHPSRGTWQGDNFILTDKGFEDPNYTLFGLNDGGQDPQATLIYDGGIVLPEITVTPNGKYINNSYDNIRLHLKSNGGPINRFDKGGNKKQSNLQDIAYAIMAGQGNESSSSGTGRRWSDIISSFLNRTDIVKERGKIPNNLSSLYIYGNDLGQYKEKPEWRNVGVEYDDYIEKSGRDPNNIKTYEGNIVQFDGGKYGNNEESVTLPDIITNDQVIQYINNGNNKTFGRYKYVEDGLYGDNVGGYLTRVSNVNGTPMAVHSDIWDFDKDYTKNYEGVPDWQVKALNKVGNPFILKQLTPIIYEDADTWYPKNELEQHMADSLGILPEVIVTAKSKKKSNGGKINRF